MQYQQKQRAVFGLTYLCYASIYFTRKPFRWVYDCTIERIIGARLPAHLRFAPFVPGPSIPPFAPPRPARELEPVLAHFGLALYFEQTRLPIVLPGLSPMCSRFAMIPTSTTHTSTPNHARAPCM